MFLLINNKNSKTIKIIKIIKIYLIQLPFTNIIQIQESKEFFHRINSFLEKSRAKNKVDTFYYIIYFFNIEYNFVNSSFSFI